MDWKNLLKIFLGALLPMLYTMLIAKHPDFPIFLDEFVGVGLWIVGLVVGGWGASALYHKSKLRKAGHDYERLVSQ